MKALEVRNRPEGREGREFLLPFGKHLGNAAIDRTTGVLIAESFSFFLRRLGEHVRQLKDAAATDKGFLMVVFDVDIDHMDEAVEWGVAVEEVYI